MKQSTLYRKIYAQDQLERERPRSLAASDSKRESVKIVAAFDFHFFPIYLHSP